MTLSSSYHLRQNFLLLALENLFSSYPAWPSCLARRRCSNSFNEYRLRYWFGRSLCATWLATFIILPPVITLGYEKRYFETNTKSNNKVQRKGRVVNTHDLMET